MNTYNPKKVTIALGNHIVTGYADDSFVAIEPSTEGVTKKVGCDGEIVRSISPDESYQVRIVLLPYSPTLKWLNTRYTMDINNGNGDFSITVKDVLGSTVFTAESAWITKLPAVAYGKENANREVTIDCGIGKFTQR